MGHDGHELAPDVRVVSMAHGVHPEPSGKGTEPGQAVQLSDPGTACSPAGQAEHFTPNAEYELAGHGAHVPSSEGAVPASGQAHGDSTAASHTKGN
jgi:hypothetical protein